MWERPHGDLFAYLSQIGCSQQAGVGGIAADCDCGPA